MLGREITKHGLLREKKITKLSRELKAVLDLLNKKFNQSIEWNILGTSPFRRAENGLNAFNDLKSELNLYGKILTPEQEGTFSYKAVHRLIDDSEKLVIDIGGGSTELTIRNNNAYNVKSFKFGTSDIRNIIGGPPYFDDEKKSAKKFIEKQFANLESTYFKNNVIFCGGSARNLYQVFTNGNNLDREYLYELNRENIIHSLNKIEMMSLDELINLGYINKYRAEVLYSGIYVIYVILEMLSLERIKISPLGIRDGFILSLR